MTQVHNFNTIGDIKAGNIDKVKQAIYQNQFEKNALYKSWTPLILSIKLHKQEIAIFLIENNINSET